MTKLIDEVVEALTVAADLYEHGAGLKICRCSDCVRAGKYRALAARLSGKVIVDKESVAWMCTHETRYGAERFREPFVATNKAYVEAHPKYDWTPLYKEAE